MLEQKSVSSPTEEGGAAKIACDELTTISILVPLCHYGEELGKNQE